MALIDRLRRAGGIVKNRAASAVGALRTQARGINVRVPRALGITARAARLTTPLGAALTAATFAPQIARGARVAGRFARTALTRGGAFFAARKTVGVIASGAGAGGVVGILSSRPKGNVTRPSEQIQSFPRRQAASRQRARPTAPRRSGESSAVRAERQRRTGRARPTAPSTRRAAPTRRRTTRRRIPAHGHRVVSTGTRARRRTGKRRTHSSPRHRGHKRVSFTTSDGRKVSFLANPKARHR